ncbi:DNA polymerase III subunit gamma/tau [Candidatus Dependentiae bacterium]|nr:DNA polymerase III subunit gamma/tau [Candidatus Dependentiae bacterium]
MEKQINLNLARKWRPQTFDTVIGQDIPIRMLKNSLYLNKFFPVYLFAGQRGCGKTTSARIFAAAVNCLNLAAFQKNPTLPLPCLTCSSCTAMAAGNHADFIEIDAASHTGVDNVRNIIESSSYMPLVGQKKVYLIDEAHMLSKAAFNAFLKLLEEPPKTVIFLLATTETQKIPITVLSRCFQLIFPAIAHAELKNLLLTMCEKEAIDIEPAAVDLLLQETDGSARDAINLLERVRFSDQAITEELVRTVLGKISNQELITLMTHLVNQAPQELISYLSDINIQTRSPAALWDGLITLCRTLLWAKYGVSSLPPAFQSVAPAIQALANGCSRNRLHAMLTFLWGQEEIFNRTNKKQLFLETALLQLCEQTNIADIAELLAAVPSSGSVSGSTSQRSNTSGNTTTTAEAKVPSKPSSMAPVEPPPPPASTLNSQPNQDAALANTADMRWHAFVALASELQDQFLASIFKQATFISHTDGAPLVTIALSTDSPFFKSTIETAKALWLPPLKQCFSGASELAYKTVSKAPPPRQPISSTAIPFVKKEATAIQPTQTQPYQKRESGDFLIIKNAEEWPTASLLLSTFSGKIKKVADS